MLEDRIKEYINKFDRFAAGNNIRLTKVEPGYAADIVLLDKDFNCKVTMVDGEIRYDAR